MPPRFNELDVLALSDRAWDIVDPEGDHETEEQAWTVALHEDWPPIGSADELRARLSEIADALKPLPPAIPLQAVAALMTFLAEHPERHTPAEADLIDALHERYPDGLPDELVAWLAVRRQPPAAHRRPHGAPQPLRHPQTRPFPEPPGG